MRAIEFITEAHHSIFKILPIGPWRVHIDTHALASAAAREIDVAALTTIVTYACFLPDTLSTIPIGKGAYFQDVNTLISIYVHRLSENELRLETVLGPDMKPKPPMFRRPVPASAYTVKTDPKTKQAQALAGRIAQHYGRDWLSQDFADLAPLVNLNRADRRKFTRMLKKQKS